MREWTVEELLTAVGSDAPVPGGGAVAALVGAAGAALLGMVAALAERRARDAEAQALVGALRGRARTLQERFADLADADVAAYRGVADVLALPRSSEAEKALRAERLQEALAHAAEVPLATARLAVDALELAGEVAPVCPKVARSDLATAVHLLRAACAAAVANVDANALSLDPSPDRDRLAADAAQVATRGAAQAEGILGPLGAALAGWRTPGTGPAPA